jgi:hypothetical protein
MMYEAFKEEIIDEQEAEAIWQEMIKRRRKLPCESFAEVLDFYDKGEGKTLTIHKY